MNRIVLFFVAVWLISVTQVVAQESGLVLDKVAKDVCQYLDSHIEEFKTLEKYERNAKLGLQLFSLYSKYKDDFKKEGIEFDFSKGKSEGVRLGKMVGVKMVEFCPKSLMIFAMEKIKEDEERKSHINSVLGKIIKIYENELSYVELEDTTGKKQKFLWLTNFKGADNLLKKQDWKNKNVELFYDDIEIYSSKLTEYIIRKRITKIDFLK